MAPPRSIALCRKPDLRHVEQVVRQQPRARCRRRERGQALAVGAERVDRARGQRLAQFGRIVRELCDRRLLENALHAQRDRIIDRPGDLLSRAVDIGDRPDGRAVEHEKALPHQHVGLREFHRPQPRRLIGDEADVGLRVLDRLDDGRRAGDRLELERHIVAARQFAGEIVGCSADFAGRRIAHRLRRVGAEIGRAQRAARRDVAGHRRRSACNCGRNHHQAESYHRMVPRPGATPNVMFQTDCPCAGPHDGHCRAVRIGALGSRYSEISTVPTLLNRLAVRSFGTTWLSGGSGRLLSAQRTETAKFQK